MTPQALMGSCPHFNVVIVNKCNYNYFYYRYNQAAKRTSSITSTPSFVRTHSCWFLFCALLVCILQFTSYSNRLLGFLITFAIPRYLDVPRVNALWLRRRTFQRLLQLLPWRLLLFLLLIYLQLLSFLLYTMLSTFLFITHFCGAGVPWVPRYKARVTQSQRLIGVTE